jgi:hypothetical protein
MILALLTALLIQDPVAAPDAARLPVGGECHTLIMGQGEQARPVGVTWQSVERVVHAGQPALKIVVHQYLGGGRFDMRDEFVVDAATLRPLTLENRRSGQVHVAVRYEPGRIVGEKIEDGVAVPIDVPLAGPVWEGNLYGLTFAALPLAEGASFTLPYWQYDKGFGDFTVSVTGSETVDTPGGPVEAWVLDAGPDRDTRLTYLIAKSDHRELGYRAPQGRQVPGGDCSAVPGAVSRS